MLGQGYIDDPSATDECRFCTFSNGNQVRKTLSELVEDDSNRRRRVGGRTLKRTIAYPSLLLLSFFFQYLNSVNLTHGSDGGRNIGITALYTSASSLLLVRVVSAFPSTNSLSPFLLQSLASLLFSFSWASVLNQTRRPRLNLYISS